VRGSRALMTMVSVRVGRMIADLVPFLRPHRLVAAGPSADPGGRPAASRGDGAGRGGDTEWYAGDSKSFGRSRTCHETSTMHKTSYQEVALDQMITLFRDPVRLRSPCPHRNRIRSALPPHEWHCLQQYRIPCRGWWLCAVSHSTPHPSLLRGTWGMSLVESFSVLLCHSGPELGIRTIREPWLGVPDDQLAFRELLCCEQVSTCTADWCRDTAQRGATGCK
jgi:hypothetical protein